tara:strand:- start:217 stop:855 length:639 start_codon:yes stop_codon:yes gene_type:complete
MIVSIHQPNFIPWLGFFKKLQKSDVTVFLDEVQYTKNYVFNRNKIINDHWLTIPVMHNSKTIYREVRVNNNEKWKKKHINSLKNYPKTCPNFEFIDEFINEIYIECDSKLLIDYNLKSIDFLLKKFSMNPKIVLQSQLDLGDNIRGSELLYQITKSVGGNTYLSGRGAVEKTTQGEPYLDIDKFKNIEIDILDYDPPHKFSSLHHLILGGNI